MAFEVVEISKIFKSRQSQCTYIWVLLSFKAAICTCRILLRLSTLEYRAHRNGTWKPYGYSIKILKSPTFHNKFSRTFSSSAFVSGPAFIMSSVFFESFGDFQGDSPVLVSDFEICILCNVMAFFKPFDARFWFACKTNFCSKKKNTFVLVLYTDLYDTLCKGGPSVTFFAKSYKTLS